jgi:hypothetical protein
MQMHVHCVSLICPLHDQEDTMTGVCLNPNGESSCDASHMGTEVRCPTGGLTARVLTASPLERPLT